MPDMEWKGESPHGLEVKEGILVNVTGKQARGVISYHSMTRRVLVRYVASKDEASWPSRRSGGCVDFMSKSIEMGRYITENTDEMVIRSICSRRD